MTRSLRFMSDKTVITGQKMGDILVNNVNFFPSLI